MATLGRIRGRGPTACGRRAEGRDEDSKNPRVSAPILSEATAHPFAEGLRCICGRRAFLWDTFRGEYAFEGILVAFWCGRCVNFFPTFRKCATHLPHSGLWDRLKCVTRKEIPVVAVHSADDGVRKYF